MSVIDQKLFRSSWWSKPHRKTPVLLLTWSWLCSMTANEVAEGGRELKALHATFTVISAPQTRSKTINVAQGICSTWQREIIVGFNFVSKKTWYSTNEPLAHNCVHHQRCLSVIALCQSFIGKGQMSNRSDWILSSIHVDICHTYRKELWFLSVNLQATIQRWIQGLHKSKPVLQSRLTLSMNLFVRHSEV